MRRKRFGGMWCCIYLLGVLSCGGPSVKEYQLVIHNASLFNVHSGKIEPHKTVFIQGGIIKKITKSDAADRNSKGAVLDAKERLLTPAFIDVHNHLNFVFGDITEVTNSDEFATYRGLLSEQYMPYGVMVVRSAGGRESHIPMEQSWMQHHPDYIDYYPTGGALVSLNTNFYNHAYVKDSAEVSNKIRAYHTLGIKHIKVYSLLGEKQLESAIITAQELDMNIFGHIENSMVSMEAASTLGLTNFEHAKALFLEVVRNYEKEGRDLSQLPPDDEENWRYREYEIFNLLGTNDPSMEALVQLLKKNGASITPTLHLYAHSLGLTNARLNIPKGQELNWSWEQLNRAKIGYHVLAALVYKLYQNGIPLNTGSDTVEPGKTLLSEMLLLNNLGIPMHEVLKIATINSARSIDLEQHYGSIEVGKKAHLVLFGEDPLRDPVNLLSQKTVIKDGVVWLPKD